MPLLPTTVSLRARDRVVMSSSQHLAASGIVGKVEMEVVPELDTTSSFPRLKHETAFLRRRVPTFLHECSVLVEKEINCSLLWRHS